MEKKKTSSTAAKSAVKKNSAAKAQSAPKTTKRASKKSTGSVAVKSTAVSGKKVARKEQLSETHQWAFPQRFMHMIHNFFDDTFDFSPMSFSPRSEIRETKSKFELSIELPGVEDKDLAIAIDNDSLIIKGEKNESFSTEENFYHARERRYGSFYKRFPLPPEADAGKIVAEIKNGVLIVDIPKLSKPKASSKKVPLKKV